MTTALRILSPSKLLPRVSLVKQEPQYAVSYVSPWSGEVLVFDGWEDRACFMMVSAIMAARPLGKGGSSLEKPMLVTREKTERPEALKTRTARLLGTDQNKITSETNLLLSNKETYLGMSVAENPYGDGKAAARITEALFS